MVIGIVVMYHDASMIVWREGVEGKREALALGERSAGKLCQAGGWYRGKEQLEGYFSGF